MAARLVLVLTDEPSTLGDLMLFIRRCEQAGLSPNTELFVTGARKNQVVSLETNITARRTMVK